MFKVLRPIKILVIVVIFMILAVIASVNFNGNQEKKEELKNGFFWQAGVNLFSFISNLSNTFDSSVKEEINDNTKELLNISEIKQELQEKIESLNEKNIFSNLKNNSEAELDNIKNLKDSFLEDLNTDNNLKVENNKNLEN